MALQEALAERRVGPSPGWVGVVCAAVVVVVGINAVRAGLVNWEAAEAATAALRIVQPGQAASLSEIGFGRLPLPALVLVPVAAVWPEGIERGYGGVVIGGIAAYLFGVFVAQICRAARLAGWLGWVVALGVVVHPVVLSALAGGAPAGLFFALSLGALGALAAWWERGGLRDLIASSWLVALAGLCDHLALWLTAAAVVGVGTAGRSKRQGRSVGLGEAARSQGLAVLYAMAPVYLMGLWVLASWAVIGRPWMSFGIWIERLAGGPGALRGLWMVTLTCGAWLGCVVMAGSLRGGRGYAAATGTVALAAVAVIFALTPGRGGAEGNGWAVVLPAALLAKAAVIAGGLWALAGIVELWRRGEIRAAQWVGVGLGAAGVVAGIWGGTRGGWPARPMAALGGQIAFAGRMEAVRTAGRLAEALLGRGAERVYVSLPGGVGFAAGMVLGDVRQVRGAEATVAPETPCYEVVYSRGGELQPTWPELRPEKVEEMMAAGEFEIGGWRGPAVYFYGGPGIEGEEGRSEG